MEHSILSYIPQRPPFVMIDNLVSATDDGCSTDFLIREDNVMMEGDSLSAAGLVENIAQTAAARAGYLALKENQPVRVGFIGAVNKLEVFGLPKTSDFLETDIKIENQIFDVTLISGKVSCKGFVLAKCEMKIFMSSTK